MSSETEGEPLSLKHQEQLTSYWTKLCQTHAIPFAEYSFANAYLFRKRHKYVFIPGDPPLVCGHFSSHRPYYIPTQYPVDRVLPKDVSLFPIPETCLSFFPRETHRAYFDRDHSDYLFKTSKLQTLEGRALSSRRNLIHQLEAAYQLKTTELLEQELPAALELLELWQQHSPREPEKTDYASCFEALNMMQRLKLHGRIAFANGKPAGFILGELLTTATALVHFVKFSYAFKGIVPFLYRDFARHLPPSVLWINLEEDLGLPGLRQAKLAYDPDLLLAKWRLLSNDSY